MKNLRDIKVLSENDMKSVTGGDANIPVDRRFLDKDTCMAEARGLGQYRIVTGMTAQEIAEEIYAHAVFYYNSFDIEAIAKALEKEGIPSATTHQAIAEMLREKGKEINITNGGDKWYRMAIYKFVWNFM